VSLDTKIQEGFREEEKLIQEELNRAQEHVNAGMYSVANAPLDIAGLHSKRAGMALPEIYYKLRETVYKMVERPRLGIIKTQIEGGRYTAAEIALSGIETYLRRAYMKIPKEVTELRAELDKLVGEKG